MKRLNALKINIPRLILTNKLGALTIILITLFFGISCGSTANSEEVSNKEPSEENIKTTEAAAHDGDYQLHDIWNTTHIFQEELVGVENRPTLEVNLADLEIMGSNGCNHYNGKITRYSKNRINFGNIAVTNKMCLEMEVPDSFDDALNKVAYYSRENLILYFYDDAGDLILQFAKGD